MGTHITKDKISNPLSIKPLYLAIGLAALSGILYGFLGYFGTKLLTDDFTISSMLFWRFLIATIWMVLWGWWKQKKIHLPSLNLHNFIIPFLLGAICYGGTSLFYFMASQQTGTGIAMVIFFCYPMFIAIFAWAKNNWQINKMEMISLIVILAGLVLLKGNNDHAASIVGIFLAIISALFYAYYVVRSKQIMTGILSSHFTTVICLSSTMLFFIFAVLTHSLTIPTTWSAWMYICGIGIIATAIPIQLLLEALKFITPLKASILSVLEPIITLLVGLTLLNESMSYLQAIGVLTVLSGAIVIHFAKETTKN